MCRDAFAPLTHLNGVPVRFAPHIPAYVVKLVPDVMRMKRVKMGVVWNIGGTLWMNNCYRDPLLVITEDDPHTTT